MTRIRTASSLYYDLITYYLPTYLPNYYHYYHHHYHYCTTTTTTTTTTTPAAAATTAAFCKHEGVMSWHCEVLLNRVPNPEPSPGTKGSQESFDGSFS